jgi:uncharacterized 2Fe-2S/4Fe-4S cluster protein (DUF4445 family)
MPDNTAYVVFTPSGRRGRFEIGTPVLECARRLGVDLDSVCGGRGLCGRCQILVSTGDFAKHNITSSADSVSKVSAAEQKYDHIRGLKAGRRLSCNTRLLADVVIDVPAESQVHRQVVRKRADLRAIQIDPVVKPYFVVVDKPDMHHPSGDFQRLASALKSDWDVGLQDTDLYVLRKLQRTLRDGDWQVTVAVRHSLNRYQEIVGIWPGVKPRLLGLAIDVGTTTVSCQLVDMTSGEVLAFSGAMNPQIRFGEDLMSRVSYIMSHPASVEEMSRALSGTINTIITGLCAEAGVENADIIEVVLVGNPIMHHLALGMDPSELGLAPFALVTNEMVKVYAHEDLRLDVAFGARAYFLPCIAGHVGADAAAVVLSESPQLGEDMVLIVDVGTNAEIILGNRHRILAASSPTGPAFEGAEISCGQRAAPGAIERFRIDPQTLEPRYKIIGCEKWSDAPGFEDEIADLGVTGICGSGIIEAIGEMYLAGIVSSDGAINGGLTSRSARIQKDGDTFSYLIRDGTPEIRIVQQDVRAIQLAKAALYAGAKLLMDRMGVQSVDRVSLAGAFGNHIDTKYAMLLGMIPDCPIDKVTSAGNAAGTGARIALLNKTARDEIEALVKTIEKIETAVEPLFQDHFIRAISIPHKDESFPNLERIVTLPARSLAEADTRARVAKISRRQRRMHRLAQGQNQNRSG